MNTDKTIATKFKEKKLSLVKPEGETKEPQWEYVEEEVDILDQTYWEKLVWYARKPAFLKHVAEKMYDDNLEWVGEIDGVLIDKEAFLINRKIEDSLELINKDKFNIFFFDPPFNDKEFINNLKRNDLKDTG